MAAMLSWATDLPAQSLILLLYHRQTERELHKCYKDAFTFDDFRSYIGSSLEVEPESLSCTLPHYMILNFGRSHRAIGVGSRRGEEGDRQSRRKRFPDWEPPTSFTSRLR